MEGKTWESKLDERLNREDAVGKMNCLLIELVMIEDKQRALIELCQEKTVDMDNIDGGLNIHGIMNVFESISDNLLVAIDRLQGPIRELECNNDLRIVRGH